MRLPLLELQKQVKRPRRGVNPLFFADLALVLTFFALAGSGLVSAPGETVELPVGSATTATLVDAVASVQPNGLLVFRDRVIPATAAPERLVEALQVPGAEAKILLLKADRRTPLEAVLRITEAAREAGYQRVQVATVQESTAGR